MVFVVFKEVLVQWNKTILVFDNEILDAYTLYRLFVGGSLGG
jgi:hypothetical protein